MYVTDIDNGETLTVAGVDFGNKGAKKLQMSVGSEKSGIVEMHLDNENGPVAGTVQVVPTGGKTAFKTMTVKLNQRPTGVHDVCFKFVGQGSDLFTIDWWRCR